MLNQKDIPIIISMIKSFKYNSKLVYFHFKSKDLSKDRGFAHAVSQFRGIYDDNPGIDVIVIFDCPETIRNMHCYIYKMPYFLKTREAHVNVYQW